MPILKHRLRVLLIRDKTVLRVLVFGRVLLQMLLATEGLVTHAAHEGLLAGVRGFVPSQVLAAHKVEAARGAAILPHPLSVAAAELLHGL